MLHASLARGRHVCVFLTTIVASNVASKAVQTPHAALSLEQVDLGLASQNPPSSSLDLPGIDLPAFGSEAPAPIPTEVLLDLAQSSSSPILPPAHVSKSEEPLSAGPKPLAGVRGFRGGGGVTEAIEEAEFFVSRCLFDDAIAVLREQLTRTPDDPALLSRVDYIEQMALACDAQPSVLGLGFPTEHGACLVLPSGIGEIGDIGQTGFDDPGADSADMLASNEAVDIESFFLAFQNEIASQVGEDDSRMHYDIGLACLEMGQVNGAIDAFRKASRDPMMTCVSLSMIASAYRSVGNLDAALLALQEAVAFPHKSRAEETGIH